MPVPGYLMRNPGDHMHLSIELPSGVYLADIYTKAGGGVLDHHFRIFHRHNDLHLAEVAEAVLELVKTKLLPPDFDSAKTTRIILVSDSLWETLREQLLEMVQQDGLDPVAVHFTHSPLYGVLDHAELSITFMNLTNLPLSIETGLEGLLGGPTDGALVSLLSCLQMVRAWEGLDGGSAERFRAEMDKAIDAVKELSQGAGC